MTEQAKTPRLRYDEGCLAAQALNLIGDRWALLVVRELVFAPKRFQMIRAGLPGITASVLTGRLGQLVEAGVVAHDVRLGIYSLTDAGHGLLPVLDLDDGTSLWESNAIACRLAALAKSELWPASDLRYDIMRWQFWEGCHWTPACAPFASKHLFGNDGVDIAAATEKFHLRARVLDDHLAGRDWLVGEAMTLADICVAMVLYLRGPCHYPVDGYANILRWVESIEALEAFKAMGGMPQAAE